MMDKIEELRKMCQHWEGNLLELSVDAYQDLRRSEYPVTKPGEKRMMPTKVDNFFEAPFSSNKLGILWKERTVVYAGTVNWAEVIHEMGHVFACKEQPDRSDEFTFFGWEYRVAQLLDSEPEWMRANRDYQVLEDGGALGDLPANKQMSILTERLTKARFLHLLDEDWMPTCV